MANFYKGTEIKFAFTITAEGFDMDTDDFDLEVASPRDSVTGSKSGSSTSGGSEDLSIKKEDDTWYAIANTEKLSKGDLRVIATAHITDASAYDGVRNEIAVASLGTLLLP